MWIWPFCIFLCCFFWPCRRINGIGSILSSTFGPSSSGAFYFETTCSFDAGFFFLFYLWFGVCLSCFVLLPTAGAFFGFCFFFFLLERKIFAARFFLGLTSCTFGQGRSCSVFCFMFCPGGTPLCKHGTSVPSLDVGFRSSLSKPLFTRKSIRIFYSILKPLWGRHQLVYLLLL